MKKYTLKDFYDLEEEILELRLSLKKGNFNNETRKKLYLLELEYEKVSSQISWDIENGSIDYGYDNKERPLMKTKK